MSGQPLTPPPMILLIDNYDSFVHNLARYFELLGQSTVVVRNDAIDVEGVRKMDPSAIVLSPGPCRPEDAGCSVALVRELHEQIPLLGVCLGHQAIAAALGGQIVRAGEPMHGRTSLVTHDGRGVFAGLSSPLTVCRYHALVVEPRGLPACLEVSAHTAGETIMAVRHRQLPLVGLQFHPESILTDDGYALLAGFLRIAGIEVPEIVPGIERERSIGDVKPVELPEGPVTF